MTTLIMFLDYMGLPRAYAYGPDDKQVEIEQYARQQLDKYCARKREVGDLDLADPKNFKMKVVQNLEDR